MRFNNKNWPLPEQPKNFVTFTAEQPNSVLGFNSISTNQMLEYSSDKNTWTQISASDTFNLTSIGDKIYIRGILSGNNTSSDVTQFNCIGQINVSGNLNNIWDYTNNGASLQLKQYCGRYLFRECSGMTFNVSLPSENLNVNCYMHMFRGCSLMTTAPELPATTLSLDCYSYMFHTCTSLTTAPALPATTLVTNCYRSMFQGCSSLNKIITYADDISATSCLSGWVTNVSSTGDFYNLGSATYPSGANGIPTGWSEHTSI